MAAFKVKTQLSQAEYCKLFLRLSYRQRTYQIITMMGILLLILSIVRFFVESLLSEKIQLFLFAFSIYGLILFPFLVYLRGRKIYRSNLGLQGPIEYSFSEQGLSLGAGSNQSSFTWADFGKTEQAMGYLLLFGYNRAAYFIKLCDLQPAQILYIESHIAAARQVVQPLKDQKPSQK